MSIDANVPPPLPDSNEVDSAPARRRSGMLCPYCGHFSGSKRECDRCRGVFEPLSRQVSQNGMGPWFIRDEGNPFRPGCSYATMKMLVGRKRIVAESVLRGPPTRQFWMFAKNTPGIAHLLGECHSCHKDCAPEQLACEHCRASFTVEEDRQYLGLAEVRLIPAQGVSENVARVERAPVPAARSPDVVAGSLSSDAPAPENDYDPVGAPSAYEPYRHPARSGRQESDVSDVQIDALLRRSGAADREKRGTGVVVGLIVAAVVGVAIIVIAFIAIVGSGLAGKNNAPAGSAGGSGTGAPAPPANPPGAAAAKSSPGNSGSSGR